MQGIVLIALLQEGGLHLVELLNQATALYRLRLKLVVETYPGHVPTVSKGLPRILGRKTTRETGGLPSMSD